MPKKILVIDDEDLIVRTFTKFLEKKGMEVEVTKRYENALIYVEEDDFDVIISDIRMPGQNGVETIRQIKKIIEKQKKKQPAVIFITGFTDKEVEKEAKKIGCVEFLYKPFEAEELIKAIEKGG